MSLISNKIDSLKLMSGVNIFLPELQIELIQPKIKDIAFIGEKTFYECLSYFLVTKEKLGMLELQDMSDFDLFIFIVNENIEIQKKVSDIFILTINELESIKFFDKFIIITTLSGHECIIDELKFLIIRESFKQIFCLNSNTESEYNPSGAQAQRIIDKLNKRKQILAGQSNEPQESIFSNLISILSIGSNSISISDCVNMTVYQIYNLIKRYNLYSEYSIQIMAMMQGAENIELVEWTKQL